MVAEDVTDCLCVLVTLDDDVTDDVGRDVADVDDSSEVDALDDDVTDDVREDDDEMLGDFVTDGDEVAVGAGLGVNDGAVYDS